MKLLKTLTAALMMISIVSCGAGKVQESWCSLNEPIRLEPTEVQNLSRNTKEQALAHNEFGEVLCGWEPRYKEDPGVTTIQ